MQTGVALKEVAAIGLDSKPTIIFVVVPDLAHGKSSPDDLNFRWTNLAPTLSPYTAKFVLFLHGVRRDSFIPWQQLLEDYAHSLRNEVFECAAKDSLRYIYLIGEGLGGFLIKQALNTAQEQPARYRDLLNRCAGITFLGTPHLRGTSSEWANRFTSVVRPGSRTGDKRIVPSESLSKLYLACTLFNKHANQLSLYILSGFESKPPRTPSKYLGMIRRTTDSVIVDKSFSSIGVQGERETFKEIDCEVGQVLDTNTDSSFRQAIFDHCKMAIDAMAAPRLTSGLLSQEPPTAAMSQLRMNNSSEHTVVGTSQPQESSSSARSMRSSGSGFSSGFIVVPEAAKVAKDMKQIPLPCKFPSEHYFQSVTTFTGRKKELEAIKRTLLPDCSDASQSEESRQNLHTFVLHGLGGCGKTQLAVQFLQQYHKEFDAVFFLKADTVSRLDEEFYQIAIKLGLESEDTRGSLESSKNAVIAWFENPTKWIEKTEIGTMPSGAQSSGADRAKWLIVFDNVDHPEILSTFWPKAGKGSILLTSRDPMTVSQFFFPTAFAEIGGLPEEDAADLLEWLIGGRATNTGSTMRTKAKELVRKLEGLPLAIDQIGAIMCKQRLTPQSFLETYRQEKDFYALKGLHPGQRNYSFNLGTVWALDQVKGPAAALLYVIALLDPESIDEDIVIAGFAPRHRIPDFPNNKPEYYTARGDLLSSSMISLKKGPGSNASPDLMNVHRLVQGVTRSKMMADETLPQTFCQVVSSIEALWPWLGRAYVTGSAEKIDRWTLCSKLFPHIEQVAAVFSDYLRGGEPHEFDVTLAELLGEAGWYQFEREDPVVGLPLLQLALEIFGEGRQDSQRVLSNIYSGLVWHSVLVKDLPMIFHYAKKRFNIEEDLVQRTGKADSLTAVAYNDLGMAYTLNGVEEQAGYYLQKSKKIREGLPGFKKDWLFSPYLALGKADWRLGKHDHAANILLGAYNDRVSAFGLDDRQSIRTGSLQYFIGNVRMSQERFDEAYSWHQRALFHFRETAGDRSPSTLRAWYRVAEHELRFGKSEKTLDMLDKILKIYGEEAHRLPERVRCLFLQARAHRERGEWTAAEQSIQKAVALYNTANPMDTRTPHSLLAEDVDRLNVYDVL